MEVLNNLIVFLISAFTFIVCLWSAFLWHRNKGLQNDIEHLKEEKWKKDIDAIRDRYRGADIRAVVDQSNKEWSRRTDDGKS